MKVTNPFEIPVVEKNEYRERLAKGLQSVREQKLKIYRTYVIVGNRKEWFVFTTTSKDIYLELGRLDKLDQDALAMFLKYELENADDQILLSFKAPENERASGILVTMTKDRHYGINFTLSSAR